MAIAIFKYFAVLLFCGGSYANYEDVLFRIIGGSYTSIDSHRFLGCLMFNGVPRCGSALISYRHVITAAHCTINTNPCGLSVRLGSTYNNFGGQVHQVMKTSQHPRYNTTSKENDISVLTLITPVSSDWARPIGVADYQKAVVPGMLCEVMGWGIVKVGNKVGSQVLKSTTVPIVSQDDCARAYSVVNRKITSNMLCAGYLGVGGEDTCQGDSGGPIVHDYIVVGIVSFGRGCADGKFPGVYVDVRKYTRFIYNSMNE